MIPAQRSSQVQYQALRECLIKHTIPVLGEFVSRPLNIAQAADRRDAFVKVQSHRTRQSTVGWASPSFWGSIPWEVSVANMHAASLGELGEVMSSSAALETKASPCVSPGHLWPPLPVDCQEDQCCHLHTSSPGSPKCAEGHRSPGHIWL